MSPRSGRRGAATAGLAAAGWALFLLPPQLVAWDGAGAPTAARWLNESVIGYAWIRQAAAGLGVTDDYALFGAAVAPSFVLIAAALRRPLRAAGAAGSATVWLTLVGAPIVVLSYVGHDLSPPWSRFWGTEIPLLLAIGLAAVVAGYVAAQRGNRPRWWTWLLGCTLLVFAASTVAFTYFPHGTLVGYGLEAAVLGGTRRAADGS